jgi:hypothetical protein
MTTAAKAKVTTKVNPKHDKKILLDAVSALKKTMTAYKKERKADWKLFKVKFAEDMDNIKKSLKIMTAGHKK